MNRRTYATALSVVALTLPLAAMTVPAHADTKCTITDFSPRTVELGLHPKVVAFDAPTVTGCSRVAAWVMDADSFFVDQGDNEQIFYQPDNNAATKRQDVVVVVNNGDYATTNKIFYGGFRLKRNTSWDKVSASPTVQAGGRITVKGRLRVVDWKNDRYGGYTKRSIGLEFRTATGSYKKVKDLTSGSGGYVSTTVSTVRGDGYWRLTYAGNSIAGGGWTAGKFVDVT